MMLCTNDLPWEPQLTPHVNPLCFDLSLFHFCLDII